MTIAAIYVVPSLVGIMLLWIILVYLIQGRLDLALNVLIPIGSIIGGYIIRLVQEYTGKDSQLGTRPTRGVFLSISRFVAQYIFCDPLATFWQS